LISHVCEECGRTFDREEDVTVHPCLAVIGTVKARAKGDGHRDRHDRPEGSCIASRGEEDSDADPFEDRDINSARKTVVAFPDIETI
jgi:hypothetical protein